MQPGPGRLDKAARVLLGLPSHPAPPPPPPDFPLFTFNGTTGGGLGKLKLSREKGGERTTFEEPIWLV